MTLRLHNARIVTLDPNRPYFEGELWIEGNRIIYAGPSVEALQMAQVEQTMNLHGDLVLPGFKNAHTHSAMTFLRSFADDLPLQEWLEEKVFPMEAKLTDDDVYWLAILAIMEYLEGGTTSNFDMYMFPEAMARAAVDTGFRTVLCGSLNDFVSSVDEEEKNYWTFNDYDPRVSYQLGFHAQYTTGRERLEGLADLAQRLEAPVYTHNSETKREVEDCRNETGKSPTAYLASLGLFDHGGGGFHCVHVDDDDIAIMLDKHLHVVSNPASNAKLASGIAPLTKFVDAGVPVALGTDGPASNNALDMFREMYLATVLQKLSCDDAAAMPPLEVLRMATIEGARVMGLSDCERLAAGQIADLQVIGLDAVNMQPENNLLDNLVYSGAKRNVRMTMVDGKWLYRDGEFDIGVDPEEVYARANAVIQRMTKG